MTGASNRGKYAEGKFKEWCEKQVSADFAYHRFPDPHSGSMKSAPSDFLVALRAQGYLIEVKETQHPLRLPYNNLDTGQVGTMRMWEAAGFKSWVIICHRPENKWRGFPVSHFLHRPLKSETGRPIGSWFFDGPAIETLPQVMAKIMTI